MESASCFPQKQLLENSPPKKFYENMPQSTVLTHGDNRGGHFAAYLIPAVEYQANQIVPIVIFGRKQDRLSGNLRITGTAAGGKHYEKVFNLKFDEKGGNIAIAQLWGRAKIKELTTEMAQGETTAGVAAVTDIGLAYRLMSAYTSFVAVSEEVRVNPNGERKKVQVPVETPAGMNELKNTADNSAAVPEPSLFWSILFFGLIFGWKRWNTFKKGLSSPSVSK